MRENLTRDRLQALMSEIARTAPRGKSYRVYLVGGTAAVLLGWRASSIDADLFAEDESVFRDIQGIKERLNINVEFARPEHFVPSLNGSDRRHVFIETVGSVSFFQYDPYAQVLSKVVRGFARDLDDAHQFVHSGMVDAEEFRTLVEEIPDSAFVRYPSVSKPAVLKAMREFLAGID